MPDGVCAGLGCHLGIAVTPGDDVQWILLTASREWKTPEHHHRMHAAFLSIQRKLAVSPSQIGITHGAARGGDTMGDAIAEELGWQRDPVPCTDEEWERYGKSAGHRRNARMVARHAYRGCVAFPLGVSSGTRGCMKLAKAAGITVWNRGDPDLADGLYQVTADTWCAGFEIRDARVVDCAPILRKQLDRWWNLAQRVEVPSPVPVG
jgi:hypothetical protein